MDPLRPNPAQNNLGHVIFDYDTNNHLLINHCHFYFQEGHSVNMDRAGRSELLKTIESQQEELKRYKTRLTGE